MPRKVLRNDPDGKLEAYNERPALKGACFTAFPVSYSVAMLIPPHFHGELELVVFSGTGGSLRASNREEPIESDRCYLIAPGTVHSYKIHPGSDSSASVVLVDLDVCAAALSLFSSGTSLSPRDDFGGEGLSFTDSPELVGLIRELSGMEDKPAGLGTAAGTPTENTTDPMEVLAASGQDLQTPLSVTLQRASLLLSILKLAPKSPVADDSEKALNEKAKRVVEFVAAHFTAPLSLDELADSCAVSKYHLCRSFKDATGYTIGEYLARTRIREARRLLGAGSTVTEACFASGFRDLSHFIQTFKRLEGSTPKRWVKAAFPGRS